ncbi:MAG: bifunctional glutamate N-acetyltransferase/amino-acid acetyltransferase ArgJ [Arenicellales bacterium WSBS_2016_MAG_OTU3]
MKVSPLAPAGFPSIPTIEGVRFAAVSAGIKQKDRADVFLAALRKGTNIAGVLTQSLTASAPVEWCRKQLKHGKAQAIIVNSGNANAFTGAQGYDHVRVMTRAVKELLGCPENQIFVASTGVIGEPLPANRIGKALPKAAKQLSSNAWQDAASAMMTTDTFAKGAFEETTIGNAKITIAGIAKGSGMIAPDMATMLSFVFTDAKIPTEVLQTILKQGADESFNSISVDSDASTSDTLLLAATGAARHPIITTASEQNLTLFKAALKRVLVNLATQVVRDGEGASKFITIDVSGAASKRAARRIGLSIANSPLVKTAIAGEDANWGRVVMAVGKAGEKAERDKMSIAIGGIKIADKGYRIDGYDEDMVARHLTGQDIHIEVDVGIRYGKARVWTCDLTHDYISINADYRT